MKILLKVIPRSSKNEVVGQLPDGTLKIKLTAPPIDGAANKALIKLLSDYYKKPKNCIVILKGSSSKIKTVEIL